MANLLQSSQTQATTAPDYYTNYLSNIASQGAAAVNPTTGAQFVGPTDLQNLAFNNVEKAATGYQPELINAEKTLNTAGTSTSPLSSANTYLSAAEKSPGTAAVSYMSPYITSVINNMSDVAQRNIQQNLTPQATAASVGSGQFGSQRGEQVLGQVNANAQQDLNNQIGQLLNSGYNTALTTAEQQNQLEGQLGSTAANAASAGQQNLTNVGQQQSNLATNNQALGLGAINALSTLGGQQQTIAQNQQLFPLTNLSTLSGLLRGYNVPTSTTTTAQGSPLSALSTIGALSQTPAAAGLVTAAKDLFKGLTSSSVNTGTTGDPMGGGGNSTSTMDYSGSTTGKGTPYSVEYDSFGNAIGTYDGSGNFLSLKDS
jgi:hypothetical protein